MLEAKRADFNELGKKFAISPVLARLIVNRGHQSEEEIDRYLNCDLNHLYDGIWGNHCNRNRL